MTKIQAYFPEELYEEAVLDAKINNLNFSEFLRKAVKSYLKTKKPKPKINVVKLKNREMKNYSENTGQIYDHKL